MLKPDKASAFFVILYTIKPYEMNFRPLLSIVLITAICACQPVSEQTAEPWESGPVKYASSAHGMVAAAQPLATQAGNAILEAGGNAADAAVATAFVLAVVEPTMNGIGGRNQILVRKTDGSFQGYNGMTEVPAAYVLPEEPPASRHGTVATPGVVAALMRLHKEHGSMPLEKLMEAAIRHAQEGFEVLPGEAARHKIAHKAMMADPGFRKQMLKQDSVLYEAGETLKQPDLAQTLKRISKTEGRDFYEGKTAELIAADMKAHGGYVALDDLKNYKALDARYISTNYRGYEIHSIPAPAGGGLIVKALNLLENFNLSAMTEAQWAAVMNQALAIAMQSRFTDYYEPDLELVKSKSWAAKQAKTIIVPEKGTNQSRQTSPTQSEILAQQTDWSGDTWGGDSHHTTHFVTADCEGMVVSITQTVGPLFGSKVITPGAGFVYASTMGSYLASSDQAPGSRPRTTIAPTVVTKDGETVMVLGAAGGIRILSGIVQTISRSIDRDMTLEEAVAAPRVHPGSIRDPETRRNNANGMNINAEYTPENGWAATDSLSWVEAGFEVTPVTRYGAFARVHAIGRDPRTNTWTGMADLDWEGTAAGLDESDCHHQP